MYFTEEHEVFRESFREFLQKEEKNVNINGEVTLQSYSMLYFTKELKAFYF